MRTEEGVGDRRRCWNRQGLGLRVDDAVEQEETKSYSVSYRCLLTCVLNSEERFS